MKSIFTGHSYATFHDNHWYRVVIEKTKENQAVAFYVDTGVRLSISPDLKFFKLPERLLFVLYFKRVTKNE